MWEGEDVRTVARRFSIQHGLSGRTTGGLALRVLYGHECSSCLDVCAPMWQLTRTSARVVWPDRLADMLAAKKTAVLAARASEAGAA